jgi:uncharacterized membrane protein
MHGVSERNVFWINRNLPVQLLPLQSLPIKRRVGVNLASCGRLRGSGTCILRLVLSAAFGIAVTLALLALPWRGATRILIGWDAGVALYLLLIYRIAAHASIAWIRKRAAVNDEGAVALLVLTAAAGLASLAAVVAELGRASNPYQIALGIGTILLSWTLVHTMFALHYAYEFYADRDKSGGLTFPGDADPDYWDFLYYSLVVAMTAQVSDVQITSKTIRRMTTLHGVISFFFNVTVLALTVNIVSSLMQPDR